MKKILVILALLPFYTFGEAHLSEEDKKNAETIAKEIALCAGDYAFAAELFSGTMPAHSEKLKDLSRGWEIGSWGLYFLAGYELEETTILATSKKEVRLNEWLAKFEAISEDKVGSIIEDELTPRLKLCDELKDMVIESQDATRKLLLGRKDQ
jgi:hypothetical protein